MARCRALVIPPAWKDVWICPVPNGHIQAVGTDDAGRRQYLYHPAWREQRTTPSTTGCSTSPPVCPCRGARSAEHLDLPGMPPSGRWQAFRLLDLGFFRIGGEDYAEENGSYGLATIEKRHVQVKGDEVLFEYTAKSGQERLVAVATMPCATPSARQAPSRGGADLLAYRDGRRWRDVTSDDINAYVKDVVGGEVSAKDFRTWHGTVLAAVALAGARGPSHADEAKRAVATAMVEVAEYLGNTPPSPRARTSTRGSSASTRPGRRSSEALEATSPRTTGVDAPQGRSGGARSARRSNPESGGRTVRTWRPRSRPASISVLAGLCRRCRPRRRRAPGRPRPTWRSPVLDVGDRVIDAAAVRQGVRHRHVRHERQAGAADRHRCRSRGVCRPSSASSPCATASSSASSASGLFGVIGAWAASSRASRAVARRRCRA